MGTQHYCHSLFSVCKEEIVAIKNLSCTHRYRALLPCSYTDRGEPLIDTGHCYRAATLTGKNLS